MKLNLGLSLKLQKVSDNPKAVLIQGLPEDLVQLIKDNHLLPPGEYSVVVETEEVEGSPSLKRTPIVKPDQTSTNSATYQSVASWTVATNKAILKALGFVNDTPATGNWKLTIKGTTIFTDKVQQNGFNLDMGDYELKKGDKVEILGKSDGATTVVFDGLIHGEEIG